MTVDKMSALALAKASVHAVETLARIRVEGRTVATDAERVALAGWSGWGPLAPVFAPKDAAWADLTERLGAALPADDLKLGMQGTYNAFYTPKPIAEAMWQLLADFGFSGGQVAELGCGGGAFFGTAPDTATLVGVERDPTAAAIAQLLYPEAHVINKPLQDVGLGSGAAAVIGNVPFGDVKVFDPTAPKEVTTNLHNYFIWRAVQTVAPGGYVVVLTSRFTMDARSIQARAAIGKDASLVGAIRLPNGALAGGTEAGADIVILRRHAKTGQRAYGHDWLKVSPHDVGGVELHYNDFWDAEPATVLGTMKYGQTNQYGLSLVVEAHQRNTEQWIRSVSKHLVNAARDRNLMWQAPPKPEALDITGVVSKEGWHEGTMRLTDDGGVLVVRDGRANPLPNPGRELLALLRLRDLAVRLVAAEADHDLPDAAIEPLRADARIAYEAYVKKFGALNRYKQKPNGVDDETGIQQWKRVYPTMQGFRNDPDAALVFALERYSDEDDGETDDEDDTGTAKAEPAHILFERQNRKPERRDHTDDPAQALAWVLDETGGRVDLDRIAALLGRMPSERVCGQCSMPVTQLLMGPGLGGQGGFMHVTPTVDDHAVAGPVEVSDEIRSNVHAEVLAALGDRVYLHPGQRVWQTAEEYLSGDVRAKHLAAETAAKHDPQFERNVTALAGVLPKWLGPGEITANLGTPWIGPDIVEKFILETLSYPAKVKRVAAGNQWEVAASAVMKSSVSATTTWGTADADAFTLVEKALNYTIPVVYRVIEDADGNRTTVKDPEASMLAVQKQQALRARFGEWVWEDADRADMLVQLYNTRFNNLVPREFDGSHITVEGMAAWFKPYRHQLDMVARAIATGATICGHCVGAGKTYSMGMIVMKLRQLGLVRKPMIVVPNHMIEQVDRELRQLFPAARILTGASKTVSKNRRAFTARCATQEWDFVLVTHAAFNQMDVDPETQATYIEDLQSELHEGVVEAAGGKLEGRMVKRLAKRLDDLAAKIKELRDKVFDRDAGVRFEQLGVDYVCIDEFHYYKNLAVPVRTDGFSIRPSKRATDLDMKLRYLSQRGSGRYAALFSGTPMSNTMLELYICMHYTMRPYLKKIGIGSPDAWAAAFVQMQTNVEVTVDGGDFRMQTRPSLFVNARQLRVMLSQVADIRTREQLGLKVPDHELIIEANDPTDPQAEYSMRLVERAEKVRQTAGRPAKGADNMLKVCGDGRRMATDPALVGIDDRGRHKLHVVAENIIKVWRKHPGKMQIAFCDIGTPYDPKAREQAARRKAAKDADEWGWGAFDSGMDDDDAAAVADHLDIADDLGSDLAELLGNFGSTGKPKRRKAEPVQLNYQTYGRLRRILTDAGMDVSRIRFIHDAKTDHEKAQLFRDCRRGKVDVILGSTDKLGVGTNIQRLVIAMHHIDAPFRPADVEQRDGRGLRPGNLNKLIYIFRYVTKRTFDAYMWQFLHRKLTFISQMLSGDVGQVVEDIGGTSDQVMSFGAIKAAATDQPLLEEKVLVEGKIRDLRTAKRGHAITLERARRDVPRMRQKADVEAARAKAWEAIAKAAAGLELTDELVEKAHAVMRSFGKWSPPRVTLAPGLRLEWRERLVEGINGGDFERQPMLVLDGGAGWVEQDAYVFWKAADVRRKLAKMLDNAAAVAATLRKQQADYLKQATQLEVAAAKPFERADELTAALARLDQIDAELAEAASKKSGPGAGDIVVESARRKPAPSTPADVETDLLGDLADLFSHMDAELETDLADLLG